MPLENSICVWLISPETSHGTSFKQLHRELGQQSISIIPVLVELAQGANPPTNAIDARPNVALAITKTLNHIDMLVTNNPRALARPSKKSKMPIIGIGILGLILLLGIGAVFAVQKQTDEVLPTLVAFESSLQEATAIESTVPVATPTVTVMVTAIQILKPVSTASEEATVSIESTEEIASEATEELELSPTSEATISNVPLTADFLVDTPYGDAPLSIGIDNLSLGDIQDVQWDFNSDGVIDSIEYAPLQYIYYQPGVYTITLTVRDKTGHIAQSQSNVEVFNPNSQSSVISSNYSASFIVSPTSGKAPLTVTFVNRSEGKNLRYQWDFNGDGRIDATGNSPQPYTFTKPGNYTASLTVINANGSQDRTQTLINVYSVDPKSTLKQVYKEDSQAKFSVSKSSGNAPLFLEVTNNSSGINNLYEWDFNGDGKPDSASAQPLMYRYLSPGTYTLNLTVRGFDRYGVSKKTQAQQSIVVSAKTGTSPENPPTDEALDLQADFLTYYAEGPAPLAVQFYNYSAGNIVSYQWDFDGNGTVDSSDYEPTYTYMTGGSFEAFLTVSDGVNSSSTSITIDVLQSNGSSTAIPSLTPTPKAITSTPSLTPSLTATLPANQTPIAVLSSTPTVTGTVITSSSTQTPTWTNTPTWTSTATFTWTPTWTNTPTVIPSLTPIPTQTPIPTATFTSIPTSEEGT